MTVMDKSGQNGTASPGFQTPAADAALPPHRRQVAAGPRWPGILRVLMLTAMLAAVMAWPAAPVFAAAQADQAIAKVRELIRQGEINSQATLQLVVKQGNLTAFAGPGQALKKAWESATGTRLNIRTMAQTSLLAALAAPDGALRDSDLMLARPSENPDLLHQGLILDLAPLAERLGFHLPDHGDTAYLLWDLQARVGQQLAAIPADLDVPLLYLRRDWLEDPAHRQKYFKRYGRALAVPRTWNDYQDQVSYFHDPAAGIHGATEPREPGSGWMFWLQRYVAMSPDPWLFDEQMHPLLTSPAALAATENYVATVRHSPPQILETGKDYSYTLPVFASGHAYSTILTMAAAKLFNMETSPVRDRYLAVPLPGHEVAGKFRQRSALIYGNNLVIPRTSSNRQLAFLYAMWLTDPEVAQQSVGRSSSFSDPYRQHQLHAHPLRKLYGAMTLDAAMASLPGVVASGTGLPGNADYLNALSRELWLAAAGQKSPAAAMQSASTAWEAITERMGRLQQLRHRRQLLPLQTVGRERE